MLLYVLALSDFKNIWLAAGYKPAPQVADKLQFTHTNQHRPYLVAQQVGADLYY